MAADMITVQVFANTGESLMARLTVADAVKVRSEVTSIAYSIQEQQWNSTTREWESDGTAPVTGALVVATVMMTVVTAWGKDEGGYTFKWDAAGTLWPTADIAYEVTVSFVVSSITYRLKWMVETK